MKMKDGPNDSVAQLLNAAGYQYITDAESEESIYDLCRYSVRHLPLTRSTGLDTKETTAAAEARRLMKAL